MTPKPWNLRSKKRPKLYAGFIYRITEVARGLGYAAAMHGSLTKDLDVLCVPWVEDAKTPIRLVAAIAIACGARLLDNATRRPHGRTSYTLILDEYNSYLDVSVVSPRRTRTKAGTP